MEGVLGDPTAPTQPGMAVTLCVRPECWTLSADRPAANFVRGRIGDAVYLGELAQYDLIAGEHDLKVLELNPRFLEQTARGEVYARAEPEDVVVLTS
jgi:iron(III) transport system ATP-binding protein